MKNFVIINGEVMDGNAPVITLNNRAFHYGDGVFESIRVIDGNPCFIDAHFKRMQEGCAALGIEVPAEFTEKELRFRCEQLAKLNGVTSGRARLTVYRDSIGHYKPEQHTGAYALEMFPMQEDRYMLNDTGMTLDIYPDIRKAVNPLAIHKTLNCSLYILASLWSEKKGLDECLLQNERGNIIESSRANLFIVSNGVLYTPSLSDGCLGGVMRMQVINLALEQNMKVYECSLNPQNLLAADELFLTNAIRGIIWVASYRTKKYVQRMSGELVDMVNRKVLS